MTKPSIAIKLRPKNYRELVNLSGRVCGMMTSNPAFLAPSPDLTTLNAHSILVADAIAQWGDVHNRGSHADLLDLRAKALTLHQLLTAEAAYVRNAAQLAAGSDYTLMAAIIGSSGFALKGIGSPQGLLQPVQNLHRQQTLSLNENKAKLQWSPPLAVTSLNNVKNYLIYMGSTAVFSEAVQIAIVSKSEFIYVNDADALVTCYFFVAAVSAAGIGAVSAPLMVRLPGI